MCIQHIVHAGDRQRRHRRRLRPCRRRYRRPKLGLELLSFGVNLADLGFAVVLIERDTQIESFSDKITDRGYAFGRQQIGAQIFGPDRIGLGFLISLAQLVARDDHGKAEADNEREQRQNGRLDDIKVFASIFARRPPASSCEVPQISRDPLSDEEDAEDTEWIVNNSAHPSALDGQE